MCLFVCGWRGARAHNRWCNLIHKSGEFALMERPCACAAFLHVRRANIPKNRIIRGVALSHYTGKVRTSDDRCNEKSPTNQPHMPTICRTAAMTQETKKRMQSSRTVRDSFIESRGGCLITARCPGEHSRVAGLWYSLSLLRFRPFPSPPRQL
jgi:hypothetical protein